MKPKVYSSYEEIDRDLKILKLQKEIATLKLSLTVEKTMESLTPMGILHNIIENAGSMVSKSGLLKNVIIPFLINKFTK